MTPRLRKAAIDYAAEQLLLRGLDQARGEWLLLATCHNLRKFHGRIGATGLAGLAVSC